LDKRSFLQPPDIVNVEPTVDQISKYFLWVLPRDCGDIQITNCLL
jgi:hypothetical protein